MSKQEISRRDAEAQRKCVWVVRWIPNGKNNCVFRTQNERLRVFDTHEAASAFVKELVCRAKHLWMAAFGEENPLRGQYGRCGNATVPGGYTVADEYLVQWELLCVKLNDGSIQKWEIDHEIA